MNFTIQITPAKSSHTIQQRSIAASLFRRLLHSLDDFWRTSCYPENPWARPTFRNPPNLLSLKRNPEQRLVWVLRVKARKATCGLYLGHVLFPPWAPFLSYLHHNSGNVVYCFTSKRSTQSTGTGKNKRDNRIWENLMKFIASVAKRSKASLWLKGGCLTTSDPLVSGCDYAGQKSTQQLCSPIDCTCWTWSVYSLDGLDRFLKSWIKHA